MKLFNIIAFVLWFSLTGIGQNNLIHNASFEDAADGYGTSPCKISQVVNMQVWDDDHQFIWEDPLSPCTHYLWCSETTCQPCKSPHSPDWYYADSPLPNSGNDHAYIEYIVPPTNGATFGDHYSLQARTGKGFVGMYPGELIEQKFFDDNKMQSGKKYTFSAYVQICNPNYFRIQSSPSVAYQVSNELSGFNTNSVLDLNVYLGTSKIKYQQEAISCTWNIFSSTANYNYKDLTLNSMVQLKNFKISPSDYPYLQWHKMTFEFVCPVDESYDYIAIEQNYNADTPSNNGYILIDDVSLVESCELTCYNTSGIPSPIIATPTDYNVPLQISNLQNIEKLKVEIFPYTGQSAIYSIDYNYTNGIPGSVYWNGETTAGPYAAVGAYICKLTAENDCGLYNYSQNFANVGSSPPYSPFKPLTQIEEKTFSPCCIIDYSMQDKSFNFSKTYQVKENIYVNGNVHSVSGGDLNLISGNSINIINEFEANSSSAFSAQMVDCPDAHRIGANPVLTDKDFVFYKPTGTVSAQKSIQKEQIVSVVPNPSNGQFTVKIKNSVNVTGNISVQDMYGKELLFITNENLKEDFLIDLSKYANGIYILRFNDSQGNTESIKVIKI